VDKLSHGVESVNVLVSRARETRAGHICNAINCHSGPRNSNIVRGKIEERQRCSIATEDFVNTE
jgi:hypothetical protein